MPVRTNNNAGRDQYYTRPSQQKKHGWDGERTETPKRQTDYMYMNMA